VNSEEGTGNGEDEDPASGAAQTDVFDTGYFVTAEELKGYTNAEKVANKDGTLVCHKKGSFIYRMAGRDRERSASYYTPEVLTRCLVRLAIKERVTDEMPAEEVIKLDDRTYDDVAYFGYEPKRQGFSDINTKDRQFNTEISRDEYGNIDYSKSLGSVSDYFRLKTILDLWCSLWFWSLDKTETLPAWKDFEAFVRVLARGDFDDEEQMELDFGVDFRKTAEGVALEKEFKRNPTLANLYKLFPFAKVSQQIAERQHFLHWELEFAPVFKNRGGFDLIIGNPPWVKVQWKEAGILSEYDPHIAVRDISASDIGKLGYRDRVFANTNAVTSYLQESAETIGTKSFLNAAANYPTLVGVQTNLFKFFLPLAFRLINQNGVTGYLHPEGIYDDPAGGVLREDVYPRLRIHAQFRNELLLFEEIGHPIIYGLNVYGKPQHEVGFRLFVHECGSVHATS